ncbi:30S ribosome-binding factor RbfA [Fluoribacter dumoffii]|uniref:Ribosome-binding factor A n=1 Tax=Fluoribacter dumoffii TaxID=463 RepID=A0A377G5V4_9GAMM|nr:30S ribosome-binding factor RbfA [Fluoribacter dumoffii]KTC91723.1 ribosome-binding factor A [Fluoribacter dumoffii NY 23]MCW8387151.1 30S ribosome-binding factor RbfA [Fluoribacter dumoffii]MCW8417344.1 30S ribosome-binding factor RbfA [Fluoribacter dumoffii]MCW8454815.1 30S ribosome-binding factor RbfA [Fluoribacter dumoffii]MCW8461108.1 30S ribosome-binding factor RbfA [Fluoribacter dumoffii]
MGQNFKRTDRVAEMIQRKLAQIIPKEVKDPRLTGFVTISAVKVAADLGHAKVYFTVLNDDKKTVAAILNAAASYLRGALARSITLRTVPQLHFVYDESIEYGQRLSRLIDKVNPPTSEDNENE